MKRLIIISLITITSLSGYTQRGSWNAGIKGGFSNYLGDIGGVNSALKGRDFIMDIQPSETGICLGGFVRYNYRKKWSFNASFMYGTIGGNDSICKNIERRARNLNFRNTLYEGTLRAEFNFWTMPRIGNSKNSLKSYLFGGGGIILHKPEMNYKGTWYETRPYKLEGQSDPYKTSTYCTLTGIGFQFTGNEKITIGLDLGWRNSFTDYLDDISTVYASDSELNNDPFRIALANQSAEAIAADSTLPSLIYYDDGKIRGNPDSNDGYIFTTISIGIMVGNKNKYGGSGWNQRNFSRKRRKSRRKF